MSTGDEPGSAGEAGAKADPLRRIVMLVPHDPASDPRIAWVTDLCRRAARTEILAFLEDPVGPRVTYDGVVSVELVRRSLFVRRREGWRNFVLRQSDRVARRLGRFGRPATLECTRAWPVVRALDDLDWLSAEIAGPIVRRVRSLLVPPRLVICHELWSLPAALEVKRRTGCAVVYDPHEFTPHAQAVAHPLGRWLLARHEAALARQADAFIAVSPPLGAECERRYGLTNVHVVPNAAPWEGDEFTPAARAPGEPLRFLLQGGASAGRGFEALLDGWRLLDDPRAVLYLRCPPSAYLDSLRWTYDDLVRAGRLELLPAVGSDELVRAAAFAHVGIIPYPTRDGAGGLNLNHLYCCPNKLSQYMQAGLALLCSDSVYLSDRLARYGCGLTYDPDRPETLAHAARKLLDDADGVARMRAAARRWARDEFNWEVQSRPYQRLIEWFVGGTVGQAKAAWGKAA